MSQDIVGTPLGARIKELLDLLDVAVAKTSQTRLKNSGLGALQKLPEAKAANDLSARGNAIYRSKDKSSCH
jgi:hypothetical protein